MWCTWSLSRIALLSLVRTPFFWIWNLGALLVTLSLSRLTYFDFEGDSLSELFLSTLILTGAVNALVFHLSAVRELARKDWDLLLIRPIHPLSLALGRFLGLAAAQLAGILVLVGGYLLQASLFEVPVTGGEPLAWILALARVATLSAFFGLVSLWLGGFWAIVAMVGAYLAGHLSGTLHAWTPERLSAVPGMLFCLLPDLAPLDPSRGILQSHDWSMILWELVYALAYLGFILGTSALSLPAARNRS